MPARKVKDQSHPCKCLPAEVSYREVKVFPLSSSWPSEQNEVHIGTRRNALVVSRGSCGLFGLYQGISSAFQLLLVLFQANGVLSWWR